MHSHIKKKVVSIEFKREKEKSYFFAIVLKSEIKQKEIFLSSHYFSHLIHIPFPLLCCHVFFPTSIPKLGICTLTINKALFFREGKTGKERSISEKYYTKFVFLHLNLLAFTFKYAKWDTEEFLF